MCTAKCSTARQQRLGSQIRPLRSITDVQEGIWDKGLEAVMTTVSTRETIRNPTLRICVDHVELDAEQRGTLDEGRFQLRPMLLLGCDLTQLFIAIVYIHI